MGQFGSANGQAPEFLEPLLEQAYAEEGVASVLSGYATERATTLRANTLRTSADEVADELSAAGLPFERVAWYADAFTLAADAGSEVRSLDAFEQGRVYMQSLSSMLPPLALGDMAGLDVLDMCAAPGGKTTQMAALSGGKAHITACEMNAPRAEKLQFNLERQGASNVVVMRQDARQLDDFFSFDRVLLDAPCTGSGTISLSDSRVHKRVTSALLDKCVKRQRALLAKALRLVKPGGIVAYSTCSVLKEENEGVLNWALKRANAKLIPIEIAGMDEIPQLPSTLEYTLTVCPTELYEGFFLALIKRIA